MGERMSKKKAPEKRTEPASKVLRLAVHRIQAQANAEAMRAIQEVVDAEQEDRGYSDAAQFSLQEMAWTLPPDSDDG